MASDICALLTVVERLMQKNGADFTWGKDAMRFQGCLGRENFRKILG
jgi:hypothetical protein